MTISVPTMAGGVEMTVHTRSSNQDQLDEHAIEQVAQMVNDGWDPSTAAEAWTDWVQVVAEAAADRAQAEGSWEAS